MDEPVMTIKKISDQVYITTFRPPLVEKTESTIIYFKKPLLDYSPPPPLTARVSIRESFLNSLFANTTTVQC